MSSRTIFLGNVHAMLAWLRANRDRDIDLLREPDPRLYGRGFMEWLHCQLDMLRRRNAEVRNPETWISILQVVSESVHDLGPHSGDRLVIVHMGSSATRFVPAQQRTYHDAAGVLNVVIVCDQHGGAGGGIESIWLTNIGRETGWLRAECCSGDRFAVGDWYDGPHDEMIDDRGRGFNSRAGFNARAHRGRPGVPMSSCKTCGPMDAAHASDHFSFFDRANTPVLVVHRVRAAGADHGQMAPR